MLACATFPPDEQSTRSAPRRPEPPRQLHGLLDIPAARRPVRRGDPDEQGQAFGPDRADRFHHLEAEPHAVVERAAVGVGPRVAERREELVQQVAVRGVDLDDLDAEMPRANGCRPKRLYDRAQPLRVERLRHWIGRRERPIVRACRRPASGLGRERARTFPGTFGAALAPGVGELHAGHAGLALEELDGGRQRFGVRVAPQIRDPAG